VNDHPPRIALFVEASQPPEMRSSNALAQLWNGRLSAALGLPHFDPIVPISKSNIVAMDPARPRSAGAGEGLDQVMARSLASHGFDCAVVAWDLVPKLDTTADMCRWTETVELYRLLAASDSLPNAWRLRAQARFEELVDRPQPSARATPLRPARNLVIPLCMEKMFESLLTVNEAAVRRALGLHGRYVPGWPGHGWGDPNERSPDNRVIGKAILAASRMRPKVAAIRRVGGTMRTNKHGWGEFLLRSLLDDPLAGPLVRDHTIAVRLRETLG
jgi:hypothetical protein